MGYRVIIQLTGAEDALIKSTAGQIQNLLRALQADLEIRLVCHGQSLVFVLSEGNIWGELIRDLMEKKVEIFACENMLHSHGKSAGDLFAGILTVPSAIAEIVVRQQEGWSYIKAG